MSTASDEFHFRVLDKDFNTISILQNYKSVIWTEKYDDVGDFEIHGTMNDQLLDTARNGKYVFNSNSDELMIIEKIEEQYELDSENTITLSGRSLSSVLARRVMFWNVLRENNGSTPITTSVGNELNSIITMSFSSTYGYNRAWSMFAGADVSSTWGYHFYLEPGETIDIKFGDNVLDVVTNLCKRYKLGFKTKYDYSEKKVTFVITYASDRTYSGKENVVLSSVYDNINAANDIIDFSNEKNAVVVYGEKIDPSTQAPYYESLSTNYYGSGIDRKEFSYAADVDVTLSTSAYEWRLRGFGRSELEKTEHKPRRTFDGDILQTPSSLYGVHYNLGDVVYVETPINGKRRMRLNSVTFSDDIDSGRRLIPDFVYEPTETIEAD